MASLLRPQMHLASGRKPSYRNQDTERSPLLQNGNTDEEPADSHRRFWGDDDASPWTGKPKKVAHLTWLTLSSNYVNFLLVFVPLGIVFGALHKDPTTVFVLNFLAIIPLASLLSFATEELSAELGQTIGGLMNASFGNAVELIVSIAALAQGQIRIVQAGMLGSILSNILLVLGCCFVAGGFHGGQQRFSAVAANTMSSLLAVATASLIIPAALSASLSSAKESSLTAILILSRGTAIILLFLYLLYLFFQLRTHASIFEGERQDEEGETEDRILRPIPASIALLLITLLVAVCAEYLVDSIDAVVESTGVSKSFIGLILLPIVGNAAEHVTACIVAYKGKMDLAIGVAIGSSLQIALFVTPSMVIIGWIIHQPMTLHFMGFETVVFFISVVVVNYLIQDGESNYLEGALCIGMYIIIAIAFFLYPDDAKDIGAMVKAFFGS